jgi:Fur family peroxide stress response transcriptional regulator
MRNSRQRDTILKIVRESDDHPTADMVYTRARMHIDNISLGTVYRNLNLLSEQGLIKKFKIIGDNERFDKTVIMHSHFVCKCCGKVVDIMDDSMKGFIDELSKKTDSLIERYEVSLLGTCSHCQL